jgi:hypothetical protein
MLNKSLMKKIWIPLAALLVVSLLAGAWAVGEAFAQDGIGEGGFLHHLKIARRGLGRVISVSEERFVVQRMNGEEFTLLVTDETRFRDREGADLSFADLEVGRWVVVVPQRSDGDEILARLVVLLPEDFDPAQFLGARGLVTSVDLAAKRFSLETRAGENLLFEVDETTRFTGEAQDLGDLESGMRAFVIGREQGDGSLLARVVGAATADQLPKFDARVLGRIISVEHNSFVIKARNGSEYNVQTNGSTDFRSRIPGVAGLEDLQPGMVVAVGCKELGNGTFQYQADLVIVLRAAR